MNVKLIPCPTIARLLHKIDNSGGRPFTKERAIMKKIYHKNTNMITISAMTFLMLLPLSSSVSTAGEALKLKLEYSLTNEQSMKRTKPYTDVTIGHDGQQRERERVTPKPLACCLLGSSSSVSSHPASQCLSLSCVVHKLWYFLNKIYVLKISDEN